MNSTKSKLNKIMVKVMAKKKDIEFDVNEELNKIYNPENQMNDFLKNNPGHYNEEPNYDYIVPSGSLILDIEMHGGLKSGIVRLVGSSEGGKSSLAHSFVKNFLQLHDNARAVIIPAEAKRFEYLLDKRKELDIAIEGNEWKNKGCMMYRTQVYEDTLKCIRTFIEHNPTNTRYIFVIDSMDALIPKEDLDKFTGIDANKVAGGALLASDFMKKASLMIASRGHIMIIISQVRDSIKINKYVAEGDNASITDAKGGNALIHYADWIIHLGSHHSYNDRIWEGEKGKSKIIGHYCNVTFEKTPIEKTGRNFKYPIKYSSPPEVWHSYEVADILIAYGLAKASGAWVNMGDYMLAELKEAKLEMPSKFNGLEKFKNFFEENKEVTSFFEKKLRETLT